MLAEIARTTNKMMSKRYLISLELPCLSASRLLDRENVVGPPLLTSGRFGAGLVHQTIQIIRPIHLGKFGRIQDKDPEQIGSQSKSKWSKR